ncbi:CBS domain-containing protein [Alkalihalophilus marmarensis]|uniref:CBS domain-containing protein n=1 Tax=Alkalihalophilus marmarensis TaxID=521377 RepID=UPI002DB6B477|nr:CBS domain-containing protein [Alkalihalophilus marmarensis]MEC2071878.1 CBS domain-containing protein [Alkalihalophilus marmarensis]
MPQNLKNLMSTQVFSVTPEQSIQEAAALMKEHNVGSIPVVENGQVAGMITDRDITLRSTAEGTSTHIPVRECMTSNLTVGTSTMDVHEAAALMAQHQIRRLPVVDNGQLVGMVALGDLAVENTLQNEAEEALSDISQSNDIQNQ